MGGGVLRVRWQSLWAWYLAVAPTRRLSSGLCNLRFGCNSLAPREGGAACALAEALPRALALEELSLEASLIGN